MDACQHETQMKITIAMNIHASLEESGLELGREWIAFILLFETSMLWPRANVIF